MQSAMMRTCAAATCAPPTSIPRKVLEGSLLEIIRNDLLSEEAIETFIHETSLAMKECHSERKPEQAMHKQQLADAERQIANIMKAINEGIITPTTKEALQRAEAAQERAQSMLQASTQAAEVLNTLLPRAAERYRAMVSSLGRALCTDVAQARGCLKGLLGQIRLLPSAGGDYLEAELRHSAEGLIKLAMGDPFKARVVAGARFELTTFRL